MVGRLSNTVAVLKHGNKRLVAIGCARGDTTNNKHQERHVKSTTLNFIVATIIVTWLAVPRLVGQSQGNGAQTVHYSVQNLGTLGGVLGSSAHSINDRGWIAGVANLTGDNVEHAALWRDGVVTDLGTLGGSNSNVDFPVKNNRGLIAGFAQTSTTDPLGETFCSFVCSPSGTPCQGSDPHSAILRSCRGFVWRDGLMKTLGTLGGNNSAATGANNRGLIVGLAENSTQDSNCVAPQVLDYEAVLWQGDTVHELPPVPGDVVGAAIAVNDSDQVVGGTGMCGSGPGIGPVVMHAVLWRNHSPTDLGNLGGAFNNVANAINNRGQVVGASDLAGDNTGHAFLWQEGVMADLGTVTGDFSSVAFGINNNGQVVGQSCNSDFSVCGAFLWQAGAMTDLNTLIPAGSSLSVISGDDINDRGEIIGIALDQSTGEPLAFLAIPCDETHASYEGCAGSTAGSAAAAQAVIERPRVILPEGVRGRLRKRQGLGRFAGGPVKPQ
jgi:probable HAF family extracellular repeat protein